MGGMTGAVPPMGAEDDSDRAIAVAPGALPLGEPQPPALAGAALIADAAPVLPPGPHVTISAGDEPGDGADDQQVTGTFPQAAVAGALGVADDPRWTGADGHRHVPEDHEPGSRQHHAGGWPHHH